MTETSVHHDDDPWSHVPPPSLWPFLVGAVGLTIFMFGVLAALGVLGNSLLPMIAGGLVTLFTLMGWAHQVINEKPLSHDSAGQQRDLALFTKLFLVSELTAFGAIFAYFYVRTFATHDMVPPEGLHLATPLVGIATMILLASSVTCEIAHHALQHHQRQLARWMLLATLVLGVGFLGFQGYEYGELARFGFTPAGLEGQANMFMSFFFVSTGFHGFHVLTGLVMLFLVWMRFETGHFKGQRHFSMIAASLYWHFVDIVWVLLFISLYVIGAGAGE